MLAALLFLVLIVAPIAGAIFLCVLCVRFFLVACAGVGMSIGAEAGRRHARKMARRSRRTRR